MISNDYKAPIINLPSPSFKKGIITQKVMTFIEENLIEFQNEYINSTKHSEERTSQYLVNFFVDKARKEIFLFCREALQDQESGNDRRVDIGVFLHRSDHSPFFTLEAKRLPTPGTGREKEYVVGVQKTSGGIERYKLGLHGSDIDKSAIVAYVEKNEFSYWAEKINAWIEDLIILEKRTDISWTSEDKLVDEYDIASKKVARFQAKHSRLNKTPIHLFHYFINIRKK